MATKVLVAIKKTLEITSKVLDATKMVLETATKTLVAIKKTLEITSKVFFQMVFRKN